MSMTPESRDIIKSSMEARFDEMRLAININFSFVTKAAHEYQAMFRWREMVETGDQG